MLHQLVHIPRGSMLGKAGKYNAHKRIATKTTQRNRIMDPRVCIGAHHGQSDYCRKLLEYNSNTIRQLL